MMNPQIQISFAILIVWSMSLLQHTTSSPTSFGAGCYSNPVASQSYIANRELVLSDLVRQSSLKQFYHTSAGSSGSPDKAYGIYYCRYGISSEDCHACIQAAAEDTRKVCKFRVDSFAYYEECTLRCSNHTLYKLYEEGPSVLDYDSYPEDFSPNQTKFYNVMNTTMPGVIMEATTNGGGNKSRPMYATGQAKVSSSETVYCFVQCRDDMNETSCKDCLQKRFNDTSKYSRYKKVALYHVTCQLRYENRSFLNLNGNGSNESVGPKNIHDWLAMLFLLSMLILY